MTEETLFHLALQQPAAERAAFLEKMCGGDDALRQRVASLLHATDHPDDFLGPPPLAEPTVQAPPVPPSCAANLQPPHGEGIGSRVGPYKPGFRKQR